VLDDVQNGDYAAVRNHFSMEQDSGNPESNWTILRTVLGLADPRPMMNVLCECNFNLQASSFLESHFLANLTSYEDKEEMKESLRILADYIISRGKPEYSFQVFHLKADDTHFASAGDRFALQKKYFIPCIYCYTDNIEGMRLYMRKYPDDVMSMTDFLFKFDTIRSKAMLELLMENGLVLSAEGIAASIKRPYYTTDDAERRREHFMEILRNVVEPGKSIGIPAHRGSAQMFNINCNCPSPLMS